MRAVAPSPPGASTAAPPSSKARVAATWPRSAATCKARSPSLVLASAGQFCASKAAIRSPSLLSTAARTTAPSLSPVSGVSSAARSREEPQSPHQARASRRSAPRFRSSAAHAAWFDAVARPRRPTHNDSAVAPSWVAFGSASLSSNAATQAGAVAAHAATRAGQPLPSVASALPPLANRARSTSTSAFDAAATTASFVGGPQLNNTRVARCRATMRAVRPCASRFDASAPFRSSTAHTLAAPAAAEAINAVRPSRSVASTSVTLASTSSMQTWPSIAAMRGEVTHRASGDVTSTPAARSKRKALASPLRAAAQASSTRAAALTPLLKASSEISPSSGSAVRSCCEAKSTATRKDAAAYPRSPRSCT
mmetsp:Transcript_8832/g.23932  ORF Transcript_8832/g.23932 Transcript_8832/m.23932 type:complete len:367 (-) Transcript_8832:814-1914(-)